MNRRLLQRAAAAAGVALMLSGQAAWADNLELDGDGAAPVLGNALAFGNVCLGTNPSKGVIFDVHKTGSTHFADGATVTISVTSASGGLTAAGTLIALPGNWSALPNGTTRSGTSLASVTLAASALGSFSGSVAYAASGAQAGGGTHSDTGSVSVTATVVNCDTTPPTLNLPSNITTEATSPAGAIVTYSATATDANPAGPAVTCGPASGTTFPIATTTVTCSATDAAGNTATGSFTVAVRDTTPPQITGTPAAQTVEATGSTGAIVTYSDPNASDVVDGARPVSCTPPSGSTFALGTTTVTCSSTDTRGNTAQTTFIVTVQDTADPVLIVPTNITAEATGASGTSISFSASASDAVDGSITPTCDYVSGATFPLGTTTVTCSATDAAGNSATDGFDVIVVDTTAPDVTVPGSVSLEATGPSGAVATFVVSANDLVDGAVSAACSPAAGGIFQLGSTRVNCSATDNAGNSGSASFDVIVVDTTPPDLTLPPDDVLEAEGPAGATGTYSASASDLVDGAVTVTCSPASGSTFPLGLTTVNCSAIDATGNTATGSFSILVSDTTAPHLAVPSAISAEATGPAGAAVTFSATATDLVDGSVAPVCTPDSGSVFALGITSVSCTATDNAGNSTTAGFDVTVIDTSPPSLTLPASITAEATGPSGAAVTYSASASDLVDGSIAASCSPASGSTFALGNTTVDCSATDNAGNSRSASFGVSVVDTTAPTVTVPNNITTGPTSISGADVMYSVGSASDLVSGSVPVSCAPPSGSSFGFGTTTVTCSAIDGAGNTGTKSFTVTVNGFTFGGFYQPVDMALVNTVKNGSTVPVKWELFGAGGIEFASTVSVATGFPKAQQLACSGLLALPEDAIETTATGGTALRYDSTSGQFIYNWQTPKQANTCWRLDVKFADGQTKSALFKLK